MGISLAFSIAGDNERNAIDPAARAVYEQCLYTPRSCATIEQWQTSFAVQQDINDATRTALPALPLAVLGGFLLAGAAASSGTGGDNGRRKRDQNAATSPKPPAPKA